MLVRFLLIIAALCWSASPLFAAAKTQKPPLHARHWLAITGKPLAATAGASFQGRQRGGCGVRHAGAVTTMWDVLSWGGETQALIYTRTQEGHRHRRAGRGADRSDRRASISSKGYRYPPEYGPLAAVTPARRAGS